MSAAKCWRRCSDVPYRQKAGRDADRASPPTIEGQILTVKGPKGTLSMQLLDDLVKYEVDEGEIRVKPANDAQAQRAPSGACSARCVQNLVTGVTEGFTKVLEITGVGYRAQAQGKNLQPAARLQPRRQLRGAGRRRRQDARTRPRSRSAASTSRRSARSPPKSAAGASPSPTRARASSIAASISSAKKARRSKPWRNSLSSTAAAAASAPRFARVPPASRGCRSTVRAATSMPRSSTTPRARTLAAASTPGQGPQGQDRRDRRQRCGRRQDARRARQEGRRYRRSCSTVAASCSMAGSRPWPMPPAKADWSSRMADENETNASRTPIRSRRQRQPKRPRRGSGAERAAVAPQGRGPRGGAWRRRRTWRRRSRRWPWPSRRSSRRRRRRGRWRGADREARPHQPRLQDREGRQALRLRGAGRGRRRQGPRRLRPRQGARSSGSDQQGDRCGQEGDGPRSAARRPHAAP